MKKSNASFDFSVFKRVVLLAAQKRKLFFASLFVAVTLAVVSAYRPYVIRELINNGVKGKEPQILLSLALVLFVILIAEVVFQFFQIYFAELLAQNVIKKMRDKLFDKLIGFRLAFFDRTPNGVLVTRSVSDIQTVAEVLNDGVLVFMGDFTKIIATLTMMLIINWKLSVLVIVLLPLMVLVTRFFQKALKTVFQAERSLTAKLNSFIQERLSGIRIVHLFGREKAELEKFKKINSELTDAYLKTVFYFSLLFPVVELISSFTVSAVVVLAGFYALETQNTESIGDIFAFILFVNMLVRPIRQIAERFNSIQRGLIGAQRVFDLTDSAETIPNHGKIEKERFEGDIVFDKVKFAYDENEKVLNDISFTVKKGETVAIVGSTGAGKSTVISLLNRFYDPTAGSITLDGLALEDYKLSCIRKNIATVMQDVFLFNSSILDNIVLGDESIGLDKVKQAAKDIGIDDFISSLPNGYHHKVSERGGDISTGQRQLISFLRAYLFNPSILILDEATSSIDTISEELIQRATEKITSGRTSIVIAHRLATIQKADRILVMDKGEILEQGTHKQLLKRGGFYEQLFQAQFKKSKSKEGI